MFAVGASSSSGGAGGDVLQLDALLLRVQLNLRSALQGIDREQEVNIITEKVGTEQDTRFEDKARLPLGKRRSFYCCFCCCYCSIGTVAHVDVLQLSAVHALWRLDYFGLL
jgi:hypothetical protein